MDNEKKIIFFITFFVGLSLAITPISAQVCGNGILESGEECDDGGTFHYDECSSDCLINQGLAEMIYPAPHTYIHDSETFSWTPGSGSSYALFLGWFPGAYNELRYIGSDHFIEATGITSEKMIYARLYTNISGTMYYRDYNYTTIDYSQHCNNGMLDWEYFEECDDGDGWDNNECSNMCELNQGLAELTSPPPGTLLDKIQHFEWTPGQGQDYYLFIGYIPGTFSWHYYHGTDTYTDATRLPTAGIPVYARLYTNISDGIYFRTYTFDTVNYLDFCGNDIYEPDFNEECDDGNLVNDDGCSEDCKSEDCGDGILQVGLGEECDEGEASNSMGISCDSNCEIVYTPYRTVVIFGDTQTLVDTINTTQDMASFTKMFDWVLANRDTENIDFILHVGDIIQHGFTMPCRQIDIGYPNCTDYIQAVQEQWNRFNSQWSRLEPNPPWTGIPYAIVEGNHDNIGPASDHDAEGYYSYYNHNTFQALEQEFSSDRYYDYIGYSPLENSANVMLRYTQRYPDFRAELSHAWRFRIGNQFVKVISVYYNSSSGERDWVLSQLDQDPNEPAILFIHSLDAFDNSPLVESEIVYQEPYTSQIFMTAEGHWTGDIKTLRTNPDGSQTLEVRFDNQGYTPPQNAYLSLIRFYIRDDKVFAVEGRTVDTVNSEILGEYYIRGPWLFDISSGRSPSTSCGNGVKESGEECDDPDLGGQTCSSRGFYEGSLSCTSGCLYDTSGCYYYSPADTDVNGCISNTEASEYADDWFHDSSSVSMVDLITALELWKTEGC